MFAAFVLLVHPFVPFSCFAIPLEMGLEAKAALYLVLAVRMDADFGFTLPIAECWHLKVFSTGQEKP